MIESYPRTPWGTVNNCNRANGIEDHDGKPCQMCGGQCPDTMEYINECLKKKPKVSDGKTNPFVTEEYV